MRICHPHMVGWRLAALNEAVVALATKYREFHRFGPRRRLGGSEKGHEISFLQANSLRILTGNFLRSCRELNRAIREVSAVIRESRLPPQFGVRPWRQIRSLAPWVVSRAPAC